jgi:hypothetical protein
LGVGFHAEAVLELVGLFDQFGAVLVDLLRHGEGLGGGGVDKRRGGRRRSASRWSVWFNLG